MSLKSALQSLDTIGDKIRRMNSDIRTCPSTLYHYTTYAGIIGILTQQNLRATHFQYLNDTSEFINGQKLAVEELHKNASKQDNSLISNILKKTKDSLESLNGDDNEIYILSFSEERDLLSQWKGYAEFGNGFSIGFDIKKLIHEFNENIHENIRINRVIYNEIEKRELICNVINAVTSKLEHILISFHSEDDIKQITEKFISALVNKLTYLFCFQKHHSFQEEKEWRVIYKKTYSINALQTKFKDNQQISPYVEIDLHINKYKNPESELPINEIIIGGKRNEETTRKSLQYIFREHKLKCKAQKNIHPSDIPLQ